MRDFRGGWAGPQSLELEGGTGETSTHDAANVFSLRRVYRSDRFALGVGTWVFAEEMAAGAKSGVALAGFAFVFWGARMLAQFFFFETGPYAKGVLLKIGNTALTVEFVGLVVL
ncbi:MAG: hypothetical protein AAGB46_13260 [Verrucomicrobiota bacterium]